MYKDKKEEVVRESRVTQRVQGCGWEGRGMLLLLLLLMVGGREMRAILTSRPWGLTTTLRPTRPPPLPPSLPAITRAQPPPCPPPLPRVSCTSFSNNSSSSSISITSSTSSTSNDKARSTTTHNHGFAKSPSISGKLPRPHLWQQRPLLQRGARGERRGRVERARSKEQVKETKQK